MRSADDAACWSVLVMNGGAGERFFGVSRIEATPHSAPRSIETTDCAVASSPISAFSPFQRATRAVNRSSGPRSRSTSIVQYSRALNSRISRSRSQIRRRATDWTRPALRPGATFFQRSGLIR